MDPEPAPDGRGQAIRKATRILAVVGVLLFVALLTYGLVTAAPETGIDAGLARSEAVPAPGFDLPVLQQGNLPRGMSAELAPAFTDNRVSLDELRGTPVVVNFWASWCEPCREEAPLLERTWRRVGRQGVLFVGLNMLDLTGDARRFLREFDISYLNVRDQQRDVARRWGATGIPETYFVSAQGRVVGHVVGAVSSRQLRHGIEASRSGRPAGTVRGGARRRAR